MKILIICGVIFVLLLAYVLGGRTWLKSKSWTQGFFAWIEPVEIFLYEKSETILWARLKIVTGAILAALSFLGSIDLTPLMPFIPDEYEGVFRAIVNLIPLSISLVGLIDEKLRRDTTKPIEMVALAEKDKTPEVVEAVAKAEEAKVEAVAAIEVAKATPP